jgi:hypothetical protein
MGMGFCRQFAWMILIIHMHFLRFCLVPEKVEGKLGVSFAAGFARYIYIYISCIAV